MSEETTELSPQALFIFEKVCFAYWILTVPFYTCVICVLIHAQLKNVPDLNSPFFKLCISTGIVDVEVITLTLAVTLINNYFGSVFPKWGWFREFYLAMGKPYIYTYLVIAWATGIIQSLSVSLLATNRLSAILLPHYFNVMWYGSRLKLAIFIQVVPGLLIALLNLANEVQFSENAKGGIVPEIIDKKVTATYFLVGGLFLTANSIYLIAAYCYLFYKLRRRQKAQRRSQSQIRSQVNDQSKRREHRLFLMATCIVAVQLTILLFFSTKLFPWFRITPDVFYTFYNALSNLYAGASAYLLWIFSDALRNHVYLTLRFRPQLIPTISVSSTN